MSHEGFTHMLFVDAIVGVGFPNHEVGMVAEFQGLATLSGNQHNENWAWDRHALEELPLDTLQDLYTGLKLHKVTHAS